MDFFCGGGGALERRGGEREIKEGKRDKIEREREREGGRMIDREEGERDEREEGGREIEKEKGGRNKRER